ncbi:MAG: hypothetical protein COC06_07675 [Bacteroidales bacterium]|nr:MAG: hypothetical protein COC06_07675 [Bacteroidales bacterium]
METKQDVQTLLGRMTAKQQEDMLKQLTENNNIIKQKKQEDYSEVKYNYADAVVESFLEQEKQASVFAKHNLYEGGCMWEVMAEYGDLRKGNKGSFEIETKDEDYKITYSNAKRKKFDETVSIAMTKLQECVDDGLLGSADNVLSEMSTGLLKKEKGNIDMGVLQSLYKFENKVNHPKYTDTMELFRGAYKEVGKASYLTVHRKDERGSWSLIIVDPSKIRL